MLHYLPGSEHKIVRACKVSGRSHGFDKQDRTCLHCIRTGLQDLTGLEQQIQHAFAVFWLQDLTGSEHQIIHALSVSGRGCRISRVRSIRSNQPTRYQVGVTGSHGLGISFMPTRYQEVTRISQVRNTRSNAPMRCPNGVRTALSHWLGTQDRTCLQGIRVGLQDLTASANQIVHAYEVLGRVCKISRVRNIRSYMYMPTRYRGGAAWSRG